jgi:protein-L-isoaspartate(D-aspartate) O-methyltransferase
VISNISENAKAESASQVRHERLREAMVEEQIRRRGIADENVLRAMRKVPRDQFVPSDLEARAYTDEPLPIGENQTISQPYMVASMTASLKLLGTETVLEIGTGCGYQAAVLSCLAHKVHTVEFRPELARAAAERLHRLRYSNVEVHVGDGSTGLAEFAPYDAILVAAAAPAVPQPLMQQLADGGRMIVPVGAEDVQGLVYLLRSGTNFSREQREACRFVPLMGEHGWGNSQSLRETK